MFFVQFEWNLVCGQLLGKNNIEWVWDSYGYFLTSTTQTTTQATGGGGVRGSRGRGSECPHHLDLVKFELRIVTFPFFFFQIDSLRFVTTLSSPWRRRRRKMATATKPTMAKLDDDEITTEKVEEFILKVSRLLPKVLPTRELKTHLETSQTHDQRLVRRKTHHHIREEENKLTDREAE